MNYDMISECDPPVGSAEPPERIPTKSGGRSRGGEGEGGAKQRPFPSKRRHKRLRRQLLHLTHSKKKLHNPKIHRFRQQRSYSVFAG